jgi:hypothetical protein
MDLQGVEWGGMDWFAVDQYRDRCWFLVHWVSETWCFITCGEPVD